MPWLSGPAVLFVLILCVSSDLQDKDNEGSLAVLYPQNSFSVAQGSSVHLSCHIYYDFEQCGLLHAVWYRVSESTTELNNELNAELTDPKKFLTSVSETVAANNLRHRLVETEVVEVTSNDDGSYQCKAECETGETAMGHFISITVTG